ncbi:hypothetical protein M9458_032556, partial [Cirrhinus mrigala]
MFEKEFEQELCVLLKNTTNTADNHPPHRPDEAPVVASGIDGEKEVKRRKKSSWRWPALHFHRRKSAKYDLAEAENKYQPEAGSYWTFTD